MERIERVRSRRERSQRKALATSVRCLGHSVQDGARWTSSDLARRSDGCPDAAAARTEQGYDPRLLVPNEDSTPNDWTPTELQQQSAAYAGCA